MELPQEPCIRRPPARWVMERARDVATRLAARAQEVEQTRAIPIATMQELHHAGLLTMGIPRALGGMECDLVTQLAVFELLGGACASTAWCLGNHTGDCLILQHTLGERARPYLTAVVEEGAVLAGVSVPAGRTRAVPGGFRASGRWPFVSSSHRARWIFLSTLVPGPPPEAPSGAAEPPPQAHLRLLWVRQGDPGVRIVATWQAMALRGSMSHDVVLEDAFISDEHAPVFHRPAPETPWLPHGPPALRVPQARTWPFVPATMLGIAHAALQDTLAWATTAPMSLGGQPRARMPGHQFAVAEAAMRLEAGRAFVYQEAQALMAKGEAGEPFTRTDAIRWQMADLVAREHAQQAVDRLFAIRGAHGLYEAERFERYYRDVRMGTLLAVQAPDLFRELIGKHLFGIPEDVVPRWG